MNGQLLGRYSGRAIKWASSGTARAHCDVAERSCTVLPRLVECTITSFPIKLRGHKIQESREEILMPLPHIFPLRPWWFSCGRDSVHAPHPAPSLTTCMRMRGIKIAARPTRDCQRTRFNKISANSYHHMTVLSSISRRSIRDRPY